MNNFANYANGELTIDTYRLPNAAVTDIDDIVAAVNTGSDEILTASIDDENDMAAVEALMISAFYGQVNEIN